MSARARCLWTFAAAALLACASRTSGPSAPIRLEAADAVWAPQGPYNVELGLYNASGRRLNIAQLQRDTVEIAVYAEGSTKPACRTPRPTASFLDPGYTVSLPTGGRYRATLDVKPYCPTLAPGTYRYEVSFLANPSRSDAPGFTGLIGPEQGKASVSTEAAAATVGPQLTDEERAAQDQARACIDTELAARNLNAYGDPLGTTYSGGPPVQEEGRVLYVAARLPELRAKCGIKGF